MTLGAPGPPEPSKSHCTYYPFRQGRPKVALSLQKCESARISSKCEFFAQKCSLAGHGHGRQGVYGCSCRPSAHSEGMRRAQMFLARNFFKMQHTNIRNVSKCGIQSHRATLEATLWPTPGFAYRANVFLWPFGRRKGPDAYCIDLTDFQQIHGFLQIS